MSVDEFVLTVLGAAGGTGVVIAGLAAWLGKVWANRIERVERLTGEIDLDLRARRIEVYREIWRSTAVLPKWPRAEDVTYEDLQKLSETLRDWYFDGGGMYLSRTTHRDAYAPLQETLSDVLEEARSSGKISPNDYDRVYDQVRQRCSALRTALANDIESRRESPI